MIGYIVQANLELGNIKANTDKIFSYLSNAENGIALLPEMFSCSFDNENLKSHAKQTPEILSRLEKISLDRNLVIAGTLPEFADNKNHFYNSGFIIDFGKIIYKRAKNKLFKFANEDKYFIQGTDNFDVVETRFGKLGLIVCFELRFPEVSYMLRKNGAEIFLVPAQWGKARTEHFKALLKARAIESQVFVMASNTIGKIDIEYAGHSLIYDPLGREILCAEENEGIFSTNIDLEEVSKARKIIQMN